MHVPVWQQHFRIRCKKWWHFFLTFPQNFQLSPATCLASTLLHRISPVKVSFQDVLVNILKLMLKTSVHSGGGDDECNESWWPQISLEGSGNGDWSVWRSSPGRRYQIHFFFTKKDIIWPQIPNQSKSNPNNLFLQKKYSGLSSALSGGAREHFPLIRVK